MTCEYSIVVKRQSRSGGEFFPSQNESLRSLCHDGGCRNGYNYTKKRASELKLAAVFHAGAEAFKRTTGAEWLLNTTQRLKEDLKKSGMAEINSHCVSQRPPWKPPPPPPPPPFQVNPHVFKGPLWGIVESKRPSVQKKKNLRMNIAGGLDQLSRALGAQKGPAREEDRHFFDTSLHQAQLAFSPISEPEGGGDATAMQLPPRADTHAANAHHYARRVFGVFFFLLIHFKWGNFCSGKMCRWLAVTARIDADSLAGLIWCSTMHIDHVKAFQEIWSLFRKKTLPRTPSLDDEHSHPP